MLKPYQLFAKLPQEASANFFDTLEKKEKTLYAGTLSSIAAQMKFREVTIQKMSESDRRTFMSRAISKVTNDGIARHLLQIWLVSAQSQLLCDFLDGFGIAHDANGMVSELPAAPEKAKVKEVVESLLAKHPGWAVKSYLNAFQTLDEGWPSLAEVIAEDERLRIDA